MSDLFNPPLTTKQHRRFLSRVKVVDGHWLFQPVIGNPIWNLKFLHTRATRIAYYIAYGSFPSKMFVIHTCSKRECVFPKHLKLVTIDERSSYGGLFRGQPQPFD